MPNWSVILNISGWNFGRLKKQANKQIKKKMSQYSRHQNTKWNHSQTNLNMGVA